MGVTDDMKTYRKNYYALNKEKMIQRAKDMYKLKTLQKKKEKEIKREKEIKQYIEDNFTDKKENEEPYIVPIPDEKKEEFIIELSQEIADKYKMIKIIIRK